MAAGAATGNEDFERLGHVGGKSMGAAEEAEKRAAEALAKILKQILNINQFPKPDGPGIVTEPQLWWQFPGKNLADFFTDR